MGSVMKKFITAAALVTVMPLCHADWVRYDVAENGHIFYFDPTRVKVSKGQVSIWSQEVNPQINSTTTVRLEIDCKNETGTISYFQMAMDGKSAGREIPPEHRKVDPIVPGSIFDKFYKVYCKK